MIDLFAGSAGEPMDVTAYSAAFEQDFRASGPAGFWKLEARQTFSEPRSASWRVFQAGRLAEAVRMHDDRRAEFEQRRAQMSQRGSTSQRVRLVVLPLTQYLLWELPLLRLRDEFGLHTRVIDLGGRPDLGNLADSPEVVVCGLVAAYEVRYDASGRHIGGIRHTDRDVITRCRNHIAREYQRAESIQTFYEREVAPRLPS